jgi:phage terminase small subunit
MTDLPANLESPEAIEAFHSLTPKQLDFYTRFIQTGNKLQAYIDAYNWKGSRNAAHVEASKLCKHPSISLLIGSVRDAAIQYAEDLSIDAVERINRIAAMSVDDATAAELAVIERANARLLETAGIGGKGSQVNVNIGIDQRAIELWQQGGASAWRDAARGT